jgi:plasmid stabilization system protein ParE
MRIRWTPAAAADLERVNDYLKEDHPEYRQPTMRKLYEATRSLEKIGIGKWRLSLSD